MTRLEFYKIEEHGGWKGFKALGHSGFAEKGEDIVCAAISALTQTAVLGLNEILAIDCLIQMDEETGCLLCLLPEGLSGDQWKEAQLVLDILYRGLTAIKEDYGKYVSVREVLYRENESTTICLQKGRRKYEKR